MKFIVSLIVSLFIATSAFAFELQIPVDCKLDETCFIQNYVDTDPSPEYQDFSCGKLSYNGHDGTDFRVKSFVEMRRGVSVLAAADGVVKGLRDGMEDVGLKNPEAIKNKECGNGVIIDHADDWQTQYCHMKKGSVRVKKGQKVKAGEILGQIGFSGQTAFPHLHLTVRRKGKALDPFTTRPIADGTCSVTASGPTLWNPKLDIHYTPTGLLGAGFTTQTPTMEGVQQGQFNESSMKKDAPFLIGWVNVMGIRAGDVLQLRIISPDGTEFLVKDEAFANPKAVQFVYAGRKRQGNAWQTGTYSGSATLTRGGNQIFRQPLGIHVQE